MASRGGETVKGPPRFSDNVRDAAADGLTGAITLLAVTLRRMVPSQAALALTPRGASIRGVVDCGRDDGDVAVAGVMPDGQVAAGKRGGTVLVAAAARQGGHGQQTCETSSGFDIV